MKRLTIKDGIATLAILAVLIPYVGYLIRGEMPFVEDPRGMAAVGLVGFLIAYFAWGPRLESRFGKMMFWAVVATLGIGIAALLIGTEGSAALLAVFIGAILVVWAAETLFDAGKLRVRA
jgi:hypothetical protein